MKTLLHTAFALFTVVFTLGHPAVVTAAEGAKKVVLIAGKKSHGPEGNGIHDYPWSAKLLKVLLDQSNIAAQVRVEMHLDGWPKDDRTLEDADTVMIISDGRDGDLYEEAPHLASPERVATMDRLTRRGCGLITFHFSTFAPEKYRQEMLRWTGGYFQWETDGRKKWYSAITTADAEVTLPSPQHPVASGVKPFRLKEEFYYNLRFPPNDSALTPLLAVPSLAGREPDGRWVAWARQREDGGRGFGTTCGHFYENWKNDDLRKLVLNAIAWTARVEVPPGGVESRYVERDAITAALGQTAAVPPYAAPAAGVPMPEIFQKENLVAWCIVPFDAKKRGPQERAQMLEKLGIKRLAYDYRAEHIPTFDEEVEAMKRHGVEFTAWWFPGALNEEAKTILAVIERHKITPQLWITGGGEQTKSPAEQQQRIDQEAARLRPIAEAAAKVGCKVALYNHGGWFGEPENQIAIIEKLGLPNLGIVYNFHHGHSHIERFPELWKKMQPHLLAVNLNGMEVGGDAVGRKILNLSEGDRELAMLRVIATRGWQGPVGILDHREQLDSEVALRDNLLGLEWLKKELTQPGSGGPRPKLESASPPAANARAPRNASRLAAGRFGKALDAANGAGLLLPGEDAWRSAPITVEAWAKLRSAKSFNVVVASDTKKSAGHWEIYSYAGSGVFSAFLPGQGGEVRSNAKICDDAWHHLGMILEPERVRLFVDGQLVKEQKLPPRKGNVVPGELGIGRTVESGTGCDGLVDDVRISRGARTIDAAPTAALTRDDATLGLWSLDELPKTAAATLPPREPLDPAARPLHTHPINRDRIYDFYAKQARDYASRSEKPTLLPPFPGLDGGRFGHWGRQTEADWKNERWNEMDVGSAQAGVFRHADRTVPRGVCVRLDDAAVCFDPQTLTWPEAWRGGFVRFGSARFGFLGGVEPAGRSIAAPKSEPARAGTFTYRGFYRHGPRVIFAYERDGAEWLESAESKVGSVVVTRERAGEGQLSALTRGGPAQWPQIFETTGTTGTATPYAIDTLTLPKETPWRSLWHFGGLDFLPNGDAAVCTFEGEVWTVSGIDSTLSKLKWKRFAAGLHQPLGLKVVNGKVCVLGRDQITRLHDLNSDGEADFYECLADAFDTPTGGHDFVTGLQHDRAGRFYLASGKQGVVRVTPGAKPAEVLGTGFRNPDGLGLGPNGEVAVAVQEGDWTPTSMLYEFVPKDGEAAGHFGFGGPKPGPRGHLPPLAYLPRGEDHSSGGQCYVEGERWGVPAGTLVHLSWGNGTAFLVLRERVGDVAQGCIVPLPGDFASGAHRGAFHPIDGQLYVAGMTGWITYAPEEGSLQRMRYTGGPVQVPRATEVRDNGVLLRFAEPLTNDAASNAGRFFAQQWNYRYSAAYGSDEYSVRSPDKRGHDPLEITSAHVLDDGRTLFLEMPQLQPSNVLHLRCELPGLLARDFYLTVHRLGPAFIQFPGYRALAKAPVDAHAGHHHTAAAALPVLAPKPVKWEQGAPGRSLRIQAASGLQFAQKELRARAGERLSLTFDNPDAMPHNWVLVKIGGVERVGELATRLITEPDGAARHYVPDSPDVLAHTRILDPQKSTTIHFTAPQERGRYPYICTFPGHWMLMRGELVVE